MRIRTLALAIRRVDYSNSSQIVTLCARETGLVRGIAKGIHRPAQAAFSGPFDLGILYEVVYAPRRAPAMAVLTESYVVDGFRGLRADVGRYAAALGVIEVLGSVGSEDEPQPALFDLACGTLGAIETAGPELPLVFFLVRALDAIGFQPRLDGCAECGTPPPPAGAVHLSLRLGGILCARCRGMDPAARPVRPSTVRLWAALARSRVRRVDRIAMAPNDVRRVANLVREAWIFLLERRLRSLEYVMAAKT
ncbi:MAG: DNA repair protein RecO [Planctomycetes bacterium]|nr:DNA repair protein RecO [Planctomycetota bacterium]